MNLEVTQATRLDASAVPSSRLGRVLEIHWSPVIMGSQKELGPDVSKQT